MELPKNANLEQILEALGLSEPTTNHDWIGKLSLFGAGVLVGAGVALLLSPLPEQEEAQDEANEETAAERAGDHA